MSTSLSSPSPLRPAPPARRSRVAVSAGLGLLLASVAQAFPPAPYYTLFGSVRDAQGQAVNVDGAAIVFYKNGVERLRQNLLKNTDTDRNYQLRLRMDMQRTGTAAYSDIASSPGNAYSLAIVVNNVSYLPIEMSQPRVIGNAGDRVRLDLTLGIDSDNDGLPDAWEEAQPFAAGINAGPNGWDLSLLTADGDFDHDGMSNLSEYIAGTFATDPTDTLELRIVAKASVSVHLQFFGILGKTYTLETSTDLKTWAPAPLYLSDPEPPSANEFDADGNWVGGGDPPTPPAAFSSLQATTTGILDVYADAPADASRSRFYRLKVR